MFKAKVTAAMMLAAALAFGTAGTALAQAQGSDGTGNAPAAADSAAPAAADPNALGDGEKAALGCGIAATGAMLATYIAGPTEITLLWGGGMLFPANATTLALSLLGQIGASFCAIGVVATPTVLWAYDQSDNIAAKFSQASGQMGGQVLEALGFGRPEARLVAEGPATAR